MGKREEEAQQVLCSLTNFILFLQIAYIVGDNDWKIPENEQNE